MIMKVLFLIAVIIALLSITMSSGIRKRMGLADKDPQVSMEQATKTRKGGIVQQMAAGTNVSGASTSSRL